MYQFAIFPYCDAIVGKCESKNDLYIEKLVIKVGNIEFERIWQDDDFFELRCNASSSIINVTMKTYASDELIDELTSKIKQFISQEIKDFKWETGGKGNDSTPDFIMKVFYRDKAGHIRIEVFCEIDDGATLDEHNCCFFIDGIEAWQLEQFGKQIQSLKLKNIGTKVSIA